MDWLRIAQEHSGQMYLATRNLKWVAKPLCSLDSHLGGFSCRYASHFEAHNHEFAHRHFEKLGVLAG
jgi:hypothetical protein